MTDIGVIFQRPMIDGLISGRKTMTRRLAWQGRIAVGRDYARELEQKRGARLDRDDGGCWMARLPSSWQRVKPGDRLWVRESHWRWGCWRLRKHAGKTTATFEPIPSVTGGVSFGSEPIGHRGKFGDVMPAWHLRPSIFMPRALSRITLVVEETKIEKLNDINHEESVREGVAYDEAKRWWHVPGVDHWDKEFPVLARPTAREMFAALWDTIHGSGEWLSNPDVVAISFEVKLQNVDAATPPQTTERNTK